MFYKISEACTESTQTEDEVLACHIQHLGLEMRPQELTHLFTPGQVSWLKHRNAKGVT